MLITIIAFIVILSVLVLVHELGHFLVAKKLGIKVEEFGFGFPPKVFGFKKGETIYSINALPFGGFVKLYGEDEAGSGKISVKEQKQPKFKDINRAFFARPAWQRALAIVAGVFMNFLLAVVLISYLFGTQGVAVPTDHVKIAEVLKNSPAANASIKPGDQVLTIDNKKISDVQTFINETKKHLGEVVTLQMKRDGKEFTVKIIPRKDYPKGEGPMGVAITNVEVKKYPWYQAPVFGTYEALKYSYLILDGFKNLLINFFFHGVTPQGVAGPVGVAQLTGQAVSFGLNATLWFVALLSLNLAVLNILPIPALDGGRFFFILIEMVTRRRVSPKYESLAHAIGLILLLALIIFITIQDILRVLAGKSILQP